MKTNQPKILVTGASGNLGNLVLSHLTETYGYAPSQIIAASRNPLTLSKWADKGVEVRKADFDDPASLSEAFDGADRLLLISTDSADNETRIRQHLNAVAAAKKAGIGHILYTSLPNAETSNISFASVHLGTEDAIKESGVKWTILRNSWYFENLAFTIPGALASGTLYTAAGDGTIAYLSRNDLAKAAAAALIGATDFENTTLTLTGSTGLTFSEVASEVGEAFGRAISVVRVPSQAVVEGAKAHGLPENVATMLASFDVAAQAGDLATVTSDFEKLTGVLPEPFGSWLPKNIGLFGAKISRHSISDAEKQAAAGIREYSAPSKGAISPEAREWYDDMIAHTPAAEGAQYEASQVGGIDGWWVRPEVPATRSAILYLHGGAYEVGSAAAYRNFAGQIAARVGVSVFIPDYRLAPEHPFPAAVDDAKAAYAGLVAQGFTNIALVGDSAGGGLSLTLLSHFASDPRLKAASVLSPWVDLALEGSSMTDKADADPFLTREALADAVQRYLGSHDPHDPIPSPLYDDLKSLPPVRIDVGENEILLDDSVRYFQKLTAAGGNGELHIWEGLPHVFQVLVGAVAAAETALDDAAKFLREKLVG